MSTPLFDPDNARDRLLAAAAKLFHQKGYASTTVRSIADAVGILSGSIFHHVRSKEDMLFSVMERVIIAMLHDLTDALAATSNPTERVRALITVELTYLHGPAADATAVLFHDWRALSARRQAVLLDGRSAYFALWDGVLSQAQDAGLTTVEPAVLRQFLHGALAWTSFWYRPDHTGTLDLNTLGDQAMSMVLCRPA